MKEKIIVLLSRFRSGFLEAYHKKGFGFRLFKWAIAAFAGVVFLMILFIALVAAGLFGKVPDKEALSNISNQEATEVYSADSVLLGRYYLQERSMIPSNQVPKKLKEALIATEDARFYNHHGVDTRSMFRVLFKSILFQSESAGGGSTLTQQLAKNLFPRRSYAMFSLPINKVREIIIARRLEKVYSKDEILVLYLNTIPFGDNVYGIKTAAERFFSVPVTGLSVDQSAVLIGMLKATHSYNPRLFPERAKQRRDVVLSQMAKYDFITPEEKGSLQAKPLELRYNKISHNSGLAPYFRGYIKNQLMVWCKEHEKEDGSAYNLYTDGLKVYTTIDSRLQAYAEQAMRAHMTQLQDKFARQLSSHDVQAIAKEKIKSLPQYRHAKEEGLSEKQIMERMKEPAVRKIFTWKGEKEVEISAYDSLVHHLQFLQAGLVAMDPLTGDVKAYVGGIDHEFFQFDHVRESTKRQVGSTFKPIVYSAAIEQGVAPCEYTSGRKTLYTNMEDWTPENSKDETYDLKYSMEGGLAGSVNTVSVKLLEKAGIPNAIGVANKMGIKSDLPAVPALALGAASISVMEMVGAYSVFANKGNYTEATFITSITSNQGVLLEAYDRKVKPSPALSKETAALMLHMLKRVVNEATGSGLRSRYGLNNDIAGKTGTTQDNTDGWFIGITPALVVGCWVGADDPKMHFKTTAQGQGAATALPIVARLFQQLNKDDDFDIMTSAHFPALSGAQLAKLDCDMSRSDRNFIQRIFKKKNGVKTTSFKSSRKNKSRRKNR